MLEKTAERLARGFGAERIWVTTGAEYVNQIKKEIKGLKPGHVSVEPSRRETAPALGLALVRVLKEDPEAVIVYSNSDSHVKDEKEYVRILKVAESLVRSEPDRIVLVGIRPTYPETGYGYIRMGDLAARSARGRGQGEDEIFTVREFVEKPDETTAKRYVESWEYLWNPTLIVARADALLGKYKKHLPALHKRLLTISAALGTSKERAVIEREFHAVAPISIDYGLLEKEKGMVVIPAAFGWTDVGSWRAVHEILADKPERVVSRGEHLSLDSSGNLVLGDSGRLVATIGVHDMVVIDTPDAVLVCPKSRSQDVKKLVDELMKKKLDRYV